MKNIIKKVLIVFILLISMFFVTHKLTYTNVDAANDLVPVPSYPLTVLPTYQDTQANNVYNQQLNAVLINELNININAEQSKEKEASFWVKGAKELKKASVYDKQASKYITTIANILADPENFDGAEFAYETIATVVNIVAAAYGLGGVSDTVFTIIKDFGESKTPDLVKLESRLNDQFDKINEEFTKVHEELGKLSDKIEEQTNTVLDGIDNAFYANEAKEQIKLFFSGRDGNFNYNKFKTYILETEEYNNQAYFDILQEINLQENVDYELSKMYYDLLYSSICGTTNNNSNIEMFYDFALGDEQLGIDSISKYYYEFLLNNDVKLEKSSEYEALLFALDIYTTGLVAEHCLQMCYNYQLTQMALEYGANFNNNSLYYYGDGKNEFVTYKQIIDNELNSEKRLKELEYQLLDDICYIYNISGSYLIENEKGLSIVTNNDSSTFGQVNIGDKIYLNKYNDVLCELFDLDNAKFSYRFDNLSKNLDDATFTITGEVINQELSVYYEEHKIYSIKFKLNDGKTFSAGSGTKNDPYVITKPEQIKLILTTENGLDKHYVLGNDIDCMNQSLYQIGNEDNPFTGTFDGNGYKILNYSVYANDDLGLFGYISETAVVKNLTIDCGNYFAYDSSALEFNAGLLVGVNNGTIYNCKVYNCSLIIAKEIVEHNKAVLTTVGVVVGENNGLISHIMIDKNNINVSIYKNYGANLDHENSVELYIAGIAANHIEEKGQISYCYVGEENALYGEVDLRCTDNVKTRRPYVTLNVNGIISKGNLSGVEKVNSSISEIKSNFSFDNTGFIGIQDEKNVSLNSNKYFSCANDSDIKFLIENDLEKFSVKNEVMNEFYGEFKNNNLVDNNSAKLNFEDFIITCSGKEIKYEIVNYYNFDSYNDSKNSTKDIIVTVFFIAEVDNKKIMSYIKVPFVVKENSVSELVIGQLPDKVEYDSINESLDFTGLKLFGKYLNGSYEEIKTDYTINGSLKNYGLNNITIKYNDLEIAFDVFVKCNHNYNKTIIEPTCTTLGYTSNVCEICGDYYESDYVNKKSHNIICINKLDSTCSDKGYSGDLVCSDCGFVSEYGEIYELIPHSYERFDSLSHACKVCQKTLLHVYTCVEFESHYIYTCLQCDESHVEEKRVFNLPKLVVNNAYTLPGSNRVIVYVELINNPGITGASFSVHYDSRLKLVDYTEGNILSDGIMNVNNNTIDSFCFVTVGRAEPDTKERGTLIKLIFETPNDSEPSNKYNIKISFSRSGVQFSDINNEPIDILTEDGNINVVQHLPGDVNDDGLVDVLDATLISRYLNFYNDFYFNRIAGDVTLDGNISINDMTSLLQFIAGGYGAQIHSNEYTITLYTNDDEFDLLAHEVNYYNSDGGRGKYGDIQNLPILNKVGYKFVGWSTDIYGNNIISDETDLIFNSKIIKQTLYAIWELNEVELIGCGSTNIDSKSETYFSNGSSFELINPFEKIYNVTYVYYDLQKKQSNINSEFLGWALEPNGKIVYNIDDAIDLENSNIGKLTLYAVWSEEHLIISNNTSRYGYEFSGWSTDINRVNNILLPESQLVLNESVVLYDIWKPIEYRIVYHGNGGTGYTSDGAVTRSVTNQFKLEKNSYIKPGYEFSYWNTKPDGTGLSFRNEEIVGYIDDVKDGVVNLYAQWGGKLIEVSFDACGGIISTNYKPVTCGNVYGTLYIPTKTGYNFKGWYTEKTEGTRVYENSIVEIPDNHIVYARWEAVTYNVIFDANTGKGENIVQTLTYDLYEELLDNTFTKDKWQFKGWSTNPNDKTIVYTNKQEIVNLSAGEDVYLYAVWDVVSSYTKKHDDNLDVNMDLFDWDSKTWLVYFNLNEIFDIDGLINEGYTSFEVTFKFTIDAVSNHDLIAICRTLYGTSHTSGTSFVNQVTDKTNKYELKNGAQKVVNMTISKGINSLKTYKYYGIYYESDGVNDFDISNNKYIVKSRTTYITFNR